jgi:hypothetical protein
MVFLEGRMMRRLTALPRSAYSANPERLRERQERLAAHRKNTAAVNRLYVLAIAARIRRELKAS